MGINNERETMDIRVGEHREKSRTSLVDSADLVNYFWGGRGGRGRREKQRVCNFVKNSV